MAKAEEKEERKSLKAGLNRSANKRGLTGKERHRYIGGALHNMGKGRTRSGKREAVSPHKTAVHPTVVKHAASPQPKKLAYSRPTVKKVEKLELVVKKNASASASKGFTVYSMYNAKTGAQHGTALARKRATVEGEAKREMHAHNMGLKQSRTY